MSGRGERGEPGKPGEPGTGGGGRGGAGGRGGRGGQAERSVDRKISFVYLVIAPVLVLGILILIVVQGCQNQRQGEQAHAALCALKHDLEVRIAGGYSFLATHPDGFAGIDAATIRASLREQQATVDALSGTINCKEAP